MTNLSELAARKLKRIVAWFGPYTVAISGMVFMMMAAIDGSHLAVGVVGGLMIFSAMEMYGERAKVRESEVWAERLANMVMRDQETTITVTHAFDSIRPQLDKVVEDQVAAALRAKEVSDHG